MSKRVNVGRVAQIPEGEGRVFDAEGVKVAIFRTRSGDLFGSQPECPHRKGPLADGLVGSGQLICPLHEWTFDLTSGEPVNGECSIQTYVVSSDEHGQLFVELPE